MFPCGFYSAVQKPGDSHLTVRSRERQDLLNLKSFIPDLEIVKSPPGSDYAFRATVSKVEWAEAVAAMALLINYDNFKNAVKKKNPRRAAVYSRIWGELAAEYGAYGQTPFKMRQMAFRREAAAVTAASLNED